MRKNRIRRSFTYRGRRYYGEGETVEEAIADRERIRYELEHSAHAVGDMRVSELADLYYLRLKNKDITEKTLKMKKSLMDRIIVPAIGTMRVSDVRELHIMMILDGIAARYTDQYVDKVITILSGMFRLARANCLIAEDPCSYIERPKCKKTKIRREATLTERRTYANRLLWLDLVIFCGLRPGETARVKYSDIHEGWLYVDGTKNRNAKRYVPLPDFLRVELSALPHTFQEELLFPMRDGKRSRQWLRLVKELALPPSDLEPYCFRHSYITDLQNCPGLSQAQIKKIAGHSVQGVTDRYTHAREQSAISALPLLETYWEEIGLVTSCDKCHIKNTESL